MCCLQDWKQVAGDCNCSGKDSLCSPAFASWTEVEEVEEEEGMHANRYKRKTARAEPQGKLPSLSLSPQFSPTYLAQLPCMMEQNGL